MPRADHFSTTSIRVLADALDSTVPSPAIDTVLETLAQIDAEIHADLKSVRSALSSELAAHSATRAELASAVLTLQTLQARLQRYESWRSGVLSTACDCTVGDDGEHSSDCALRKALLTASSPEQMCDLLLAREQACRNQRKLIKQLKSDNAQLRKTYDAMCSLLNKGEKGKGKWLKEDEVEEEDECESERTERKTEDRLDSLSVRLQQAGQIACDVASRVEERLKITARDVSNFRRSVTVNAGLYTTERRSVMGNKMLPAHDGSNTNAQTSTHVKVSATSKTVLNDHVQEDQDDLEADKENKINMGNDPNTKRNTGYDSDDSYVSLPASPCRVRSPGLSMRVAPPASPSKGGTQDEYDAAIALEDSSSSCVPYDVERSLTEQHYRQATDELMRTVALQQEAHAKLRATVQELIDELARIDPAAVADVKRLREEAAQTKDKMENLEKTVLEKDEEISSLKRQLTKVVAEYEAISVAHSYSNAELSKIRAGIREKSKVGNGNGNQKGKEDRERRHHHHHHHGGAMQDVGNSENGRHVRKIHFR